VELETLIPSNATGDSDDDKEEEEEEHAKPVSSVPFLRNVEEPAEMGEYMDPIMERNVTFKRGLDVLFAPYNLISIRCVRKAEGGKSLISSSQNRPFLLVLKANHENLHPNSANILPIFSAHI
jgi:hypothetical protein